MLDECLLPDTTNYEPSPALAANKTRSISLAEL